jgi:uncharacterized protein YecE (DUF72 family)
VGERGGAARTIRVGTAGWSYPDWEERVYPAAKPPGFHPLAQLSRTFGCVEVNSTFYGLPDPRHAERWVELVAEHRPFRFVVKLLREFTHAAESAEGLESERWGELAARFRAGIAPLVRARRLSAVLVQFPVSFLFGRQELRRLGRLRGLLEDLPAVLEVRHESWFTPPGIDAVRGIGFSLAHVDLPEAWNHPPPHHPPTGPIGYLRLHGRNSRAWFRPGAGRDERYDYLYDERELDGLAARARRVASEHAETFVVANNHFGGQAVANAIELLHRLTGEPVPAPALLVRAFPRLAPIVHPEGQQELF